MSGETPNSEKFDVRPFLYRLPGFVLDGLLNSNRRDNAQRPITFRINCTELPFCLIQINLSHLKGQQGHLLTIGEGEVF